MAERGLSVCPATVVDAPVERVWDLVARPAGIERWADVTLVGVESDGPAEPEGPAEPGQRLHLVTRAVGWTFALTIEVLEVDAVSRRVRLLVELPLGVVNDETITMADAGDGRTAVRFG